MTKTKNEVRREAVRHKVVKDVCMFAAISVSHDDGHGMRMEVVIRHVVDVRSAWTRQNIQVPEQGSAM